MKKFIFLLVFVILSANMYSQWEPCNNGLNGGDIITIVSDGSNIYTGTNGGGIFKSSDNGQNWSAVNSGLTNFTVNCITTSGNKIIAGTDGGIFYSTNKGVKWDTASINLSYMQAHCFTKAGNNIYAGMKAGLVFISSDDGINWKQYKNPLMLDVYSLAFNDSTLYAGTGNGIFSTSLHNDSIPWTIFALSSDTYPFIIYSLIVQDSNILAGINGLIFKTTNNGKKWTSIDSGISGKGMSILSLVKTDSTIYATTRGGGGGVYISKDFGKNWTWVSNGLIDSAGYNGVNCVSLIGDNVYAGTQGDGVYISKDNCNSWNEVNNGLNACLINSIYQQGTNLIAAAFSRGIFISKDNGNSWKMSNLGLTNTRIWSISGITNKLFAGTENGVFMSTNKGDSWNKLDMTIPGTTSLYFLCMATDGNNIYTGGYKGMLKSTDNGINWEQTGNSSTNNSYVYSIGIKDNNIYAGASNGFYISTDIGNNWVKTPNMPRGNVNSLAFSNNCIFAAGDGIYMSSDNGANWVKTGDTSYYYTVKSLASNRYCIFAGTKSGGGGIFLSDPTGLTWTPVNSGLPNNSLSIYNLMINDSIIYAGTFGGGIYKANLHNFAINDVKENSKNSTGYIIFPNPTSDFIEISGIPEINRRVNPTVDYAFNIQIFNMLGELILTKENQNTEKQRIDVNGLVSGIYFIKIGTAIKKFVKI